VWRCHVGLDRPDPLAPKAREFLLPYVRDADAYVSSRAAFAWEGLEKEVAIIPPSIDAFSPKPRGPPRSALGAAPAALV
jgi:trehalose synthase